MQLVISKRDDSSLLLTVSFSISLNHHITLFFLMGVKDKKKESKPSNPTNPKEKNQEPVCNCIVFIIVGKER